MIEFKQNVDRDAMLVEAGMYGGFEAVCSCAMSLSQQGHEEFRKGPDTVIAHAAWLKAQPQEYIASVIAKIMGGPSD